MGRWATRARCLLDRFVHSTRAAAAVEFALILPIMLFVYIGTMEASALISMDRRVQTIAGTLGDLVARSNDKITTSELENYFNAATGIMQPFPDDTLRQTVTSVYVKPNGTTQVKWSQGYHGGTTKPVDSVYPLPSEVVSMSKGKYVIVAEAWYSYTPLLGIVYSAAIPLYRQNFYLPRFGDEIRCCS